MAWQPGSAMAGGGGGQASEGAQLGTEYTLQGWTKHFVRL